MATDKNRRAANAAAYTEGRQTGKYFDAPIFRVLNDAARAENLADEASRFRPNEFMGMRFDIDEVSGEEAKAIGREAKEWGQKARQGARAARAKTKALRDRNGRMK